MIRIRFGRKLFFYFHLQFSQLRPAFYKSAGTSFSENKAKLYRKSCPSVRQTVHIGCYLGYEDKKALHIHTITGQIDMFPDRALKYCILFSYKSITFKNIFLPTFFVDFQSHFLSMLMQQCKRWMQLVKCYLIILKI